MLIQSKKPILFILAIVGTVTTFGYIAIIPHLLHTDHILHVMIHEAGMILAAFLVSLSIIAYSKTRLPRMLFSSAAFGILLVAQAVYLFAQVTHSPANLLDPAEIYDILIVVMTGLFAIGLFYKLSYR